MKKVRPSFSALDQFLNCERQFFYRRILGLPEPPSFYLAVGILYHDCLAELIEKREVDVEAALARAKRAPGWTCPTPDDALIEEVQTNLQRVVDEVLTPMGLSGWDPTAGDLGCQVEKWSNEINPKARFCAKIDFLSFRTPIVDDGRIVDYEEEPCVVDWKTVFGTFRKRTQESTDASAQLALYCLEAGVHNAAFVEIPRDPDQDIRTIVTHFDNADLARWSQYFDEQFAAIRTRGDKEAAYRLAAPGHRLCSVKWCAYWNRCPGGALVQSR